MSNTNMINTETTSRHVTRHPEILGGEPIITETQTSEHVAIITTLAEIYTDEDRSALVA